MGSHSVEPGTVLADRYVVEDLLTEEGDSQSWRARDRILARSVVLQLLPSSSPYAEEMLAAAKRASRVGDARILQVLDAVDDGTLAYVVREWATGQSLEVMLHEGPLASGRAAWLTREVATAIASAHRLGLTHRRLAPDTVVVTKSSGVKVVGLGMFAALREEQPDADPELEDTRDLGRLLYACLTARWPGGEHSGLPAAPTEHGRLLRPRQVRAGVPRPLDTLCDRILGEPPRVGTPIRTVPDVTEALTQILVGNGVGEPAGVGLSATSAVTAPSQGDPPPALLTSDDGVPTTASPPPVYPASGQPNGDDRTPFGRTLLWIVVGVLIAGAVLLAYMIGQNGLTTSAGSPPANSPDSTSHSSGPAAATHPIKITHVTSFDPKPLGTGDENPEQAHLAVDGNPSTAWQTMSYFNNPHLGGLKPGVGLVLDLGHSQPVSHVEVTLVGAPTTVQLRAAPPDASSAPTASASQYRLLGTVHAAGTTASFDLTQPAQTRFLLVWLTSLPADGPNTYRGQIAEIKATG